MFWLFCISEKMTKTPPPRLEARQQPWQSQPAKDQASGSGGQDIIPSVKTIKGDWLKDIGTIAIKGAIKKKKTTPQIKR